VRLARRTVEVDVRVARARLDHLYGQRAPLAAAIEVARDNVAILQARYKNGDAMVIELLQAQIDLTTVERQLADLGTQIRLAWLELDAALGNIVGTT
jgi:outer membrane protein TolC